MDIASNAKLKPAHLPNPNERNLVFNAACRLSARPSPHQYVPGVLIECGGALNYPADSNGYSLTTSTARDLARIMLHATYGRLWHQYWRGHRCDCAHGTKTLA